MFHAQYLCPLCQQPLRAISGGYRCANNHCYDIAKQGYVNLLPVQHKHSKEPGDNKKMVDARRAFLTKGFYQPLITRISQMHQDLGDADTPVLDAGCGEGFYTHQHKRANNQVYGVDIAKEAIKIAAKRYQDCFFSVGTLANLPFADALFGWMFSIYAPILEQEFSRVLRPGGYLLTVTPAEKHLFELKSLIYRQANLHDTAKNPIKNLTLISEEKLNYVMSFEQSEDLINLLSMTPFAFKVTDELLNDLKSREHFTCQADFLIRLYQKAD
jgi:23S rRNA (guanine745-N1)-methyltransferase